MNCPKHRFFKKIKKRSNGCWEWQAATDRSGYGQFNLHGKVLPAHKVSYQWTNGKVKKGLVLMHTCDNRKCCNPDHLIPGTQAENMADMVAKGRSTRGRKHHAAKMTPTKVKNLRKGYESGDHTITSLSNKYNISSSAVSAIVNNLTWTHV